MEELRSTEILDREIQEDARRKAERILKASETECAEILAAVDARVEATRREKEAEYARRAEAHARDSDSAVPLEKQRRLVSFVDREVRAALDAYLACLSTTRKDALLVSLASRYASALSGSPVTVRAVGMDAARARAVAERALGPITISSVEAVAAADFAASCAAGNSCAPATPAGALDEGIVLESADGIVSCRATMGEIREGLLSTKRQEMADALLGGRLPR